MANEKTVVVLGGGIGGVVAASELRKRLSKEHSVILIEKENTHRFSPSYLWLMIDQREAHQIERPIENLRSRGVTVVTETVEHIDPSTRKIKAGGREYQADYLVVALGAELAPEAVPGLAESGYNLYTLSGAESLRRARKELRAGRVVVLVSAMPFKCPAAPYEAAMLLESDFRKRGLRDRVSFAVYTPEPGPMPVTGQANSDKVKQMVESKGIEFFPGHAVKTVERASRTLEFANGAKAKFDLLAYIPPHRAPAVVREAGLTEESGWVPVDKHKLTTRFPNVYAIGDVVGIMLPFGKPLPKAGVFAHGQAEVVANNIANEITGKGRAHTFDGHGSCYIEVGDGRAGMGSGNFYADPAPDIRIRYPSMFHHFGKVLVEKYWLYRWF